MITLKSCPICKAKDFSSFTGISLGPEVELEIMPAVKVKGAIYNCYLTCRNCSVIFQNPRMSEQELERFYSEGYYRNTIYGTREQEYNFELKRAYVDSAIIKEHLGNPTSHLDIGCGHGYLLDAVGAEVKVGIESDIDYVNIKNIDVYPKMNKIPHNSFDLVTMTHVLEHVPDPVGFLKKAIRFVKKDKYLVIEVPASEVKNGEKRPSLDFVHLFHFEIDTLKYLCKLVELHILHIQLTPHTLLICQK